MNKLKGDPLVGFVIVIFGLAFLFPSIGYGLMSPKGLPGPGAGFFPLITSSFTIFFGLWVMVDALKNGGANYFGDDTEQRSNFKVIFSLIAIFTVFAFIWYFINFYLGIAVLSVAFNYIFGRTWVFNLIFTVIIEALLFGIFEQVLYIQFEM